MDEASADELCALLLGQLDVWKSWVILKLREFFEREYTAIIANGAQNGATLSTSQLVKAIQTLVTCNNVLVHYNNRSHFDLELHFRCLISALRLLSLHGVREGGLRLTTFEELYSRMPSWQEYHNRQMSPARDVEEKVKNYNNEFLIVYATDLISSIPSDRTILDNLTDRVMAAGSSVGHFVIPPAIYLMQYNKNFVEAIKSVRKAIEIKHRPLPWHFQYRTMDELCRSILTLQHVENEDLPEMLNTIQECAVDELCGILQRELEAGFNSGNIRQTARAANDALGRPALARRRHFAYGILDLIEQFAKHLDNGKIHSKVVEIASRIAQESPRSFMRCKAFEVLIAISQKTGATHTVNLVNEMLERNVQQGLKEKATIQWTVMRRRALDLEDYFRTAEKKVPSNFNKLKRKTPIVRDLSEMLKLIEDVSGSMTCLIGTEEEPVVDLTKLPCGHFVSARAWMTYQSKYPNKRLECPAGCSGVIEELPPALPMAAINEATERIRRDTEWLKKVLSDDFPVSPPIAPHAEAILINLDDEDPAPSASTQPIFSPPPVSPTTKESNRTVLNHLMDLPDNPPRFLHPDPPAPSTPTAENSEGSHLRPPDSPTAESSERRETWGPMELQLRSPFDRSASISTVSTSASAHRSPTIQVDRYASESIDPRSPSPVERRSILPTPDSPRFTAPLIIRSSQTSESIDPQFPSSAGRCSTVPSPSSPQFPLLFIPSRTSQVSEPPISPTFTARSSFDHNPHDLKSFRATPALLQVLQRTKDICRTTTLSPSCQKFAYINSGSFSIFSIPPNRTIYEDECCGFNDGRFGVRPETAATAPREMRLRVALQYTWATMNDERLYIACMEPFIDIRSVLSGERIGLISGLEAPCRNIQLSPNGAMVAVGLKSGELLMYFTDDVTGKHPLSIMGGPRLINCIAFSPDPQFLAVCTSNSYVKIFRVDEPGHVVACYDRQLSEKACAGSYYGVTAIAFSFDGTALLVLADANNGYPVLIKDIFHGQQPIMFNEYKFKNRFGVYSPISNTALIITRKGTVKVLNLAEGRRLWHMKELSDEQLELNPRRERDCSLGFSSDGTRAIAMDSKGQLIIIDFSIER